MEQLLISMVELYDNYGDKIGYTKKELDKLIKHYQLIEKGSWNELGTIVLYNNDYISKDRFCKDLDLVYKDKDFWMVFDSFEYILPLSYNFEAKILDGKIWEDWEPSSFYDYDFEISDFNDNTLKEIVNFCIRHNCTIDTEEKEDIEITKKNTIISDGEIYIGKEKLNDHIDDDGMEDLKQQIQFAIAEAYDVAESNEVYNVCKRNFEEGYGEFKWISKKIKNKDGKDISVEKLLVKLDVDLSEVESKLKDIYEYEGIIEYSDSQHHFGNMYHVLNELDLISMDKPNYNYLNAYPDDEQLNYSVVERLSSE